ncbi:ScbR family autoregulator-binding transcription factor [Streptomyces sp. MNP-20]|uniref:ScbR family autoregulator-binding transcription factor n=1 Tax=Streptomyces sp. MNP-20 TaxID=2721165 RepID=UPI001554758C|nr:ScbR family autoregulator-binding transcription factor [Streptomyces sp. MNP-20]
MVEPKQERAVKTRDDILRAAALAFDELGYRGASMREIMRRAGVTLGAVYFHFENKEALARAVIRAQPEVMVPRVHSQGLQRLVDLSLVWAPQLNVNPLLRAGVRLAVEQRSHGIEDDTSFYEWEKIFQGWLEVAREQGELAPGVEPEVVAEFVVGAMTGTQQHAHLTGTTAALPQRIVHMWQLLLPGIARVQAAAAIDLDPGRGR